VALTVTFTAADLRGVPATTVPTAITAAGLMEGLEAIMAAAALMAAASAVEATTTD
jgi:hypothetical protein